MKAKHRNSPNAVSFLYLLPLLAGWLELDIVLRCHYTDVGMVGWDHLPAWLFTIGWAILMTGLVLALPRALKWFFLSIPLLACAVCALAHTGFYNCFGTMFSLSILSFVGDGQFADSSYIMLDDEILAAAIVAVALIVLSAILLKLTPRRSTPGTVGAGLILFLIGLGFLVGTGDAYYPPMDTVIWKNEASDAPTITYHEFTDKTNCLMLSGLYQNTARDIWFVLKPASTLTGGEREQVEEYIAEYEAEARPNEYTGLLAGKNVIMVQLEAIDTWMLCDEYMPNLARLKSESISFANHYTPAYIAAGTFNTEFMVHTSLLPARGSTPSTVYTQNSYPYALASLFAGKGYTTRSFHSSPASVYDRGAIHQNLGYESYTSGKDMEMAYTQMDRHLLNGFDAMTEGDPFFSFIITVSAHGPYSTENEIYRSHAEAAEAAATRTDGNYVFAVAGAMETDQFVGDLVERLRESGHLDDTVLIFYADHYNYYMLNDALQMDIKGVDNLNMLQHTDFFVWAEDLEPVSVEKVTYTPDVLPTLANLFDLDLDGAFLAGHDGLGDGGGYVFFADGSWYDGRTYWDSSTPAVDSDLNARINRVSKLSSFVLNGNYYGE